MLKVVKASGPNGEALEVETADVEPVRHDVDGKPVITATDLILRLQDAATKMSAHNPNRVLVMNAAYAIRQLVDRLAFHESDGSMKVKA